jgi:hypothetical protein
MPLQRLFAIVLLCAVSVWAANFWDTKPFTEWTDSEIQKIIQDSPWGDRMGVRTGERGVVANDEAKGPIMGELEAQVTLVWQTALPVRQALAKAQFKNEVGTSPQARALIERQEDVHVLRVTGLPGSVREAASNKAQLIADTVIKIKNKPDLKPSDIQMGAAPAPGARGGAAPAAAGEAPAAPAGRGGRGGGGFTPPAGNFGGGRGFGGNFDLYYVFPKSAGISPADNELEFISKLGKVTVRKKFKLKDMVFNGKFEM